MTEPSELLFDSLDAALLSCEDYTAEEAARACGMSADDDDVHVTRVVRDGRAFWRVEA